MRCVYSELKTVASPLTHFPVGQVESKLHLPGPFTYLPQAVGQTLVSTPALVYSQGILKKDLGINSLPIHFFATVFVNVSRNTSHKD